MSTDGLRFMQWDGLPIGKKHWALTRQGGVALSPKAFSIFKKIKTPDKGIITEAEALFLKTVLNEINDSQIKPGTVIETGLDKELIIGVKYQQ